MPEGLEIVLIGALTTRTCSDNSILAALILTTLMIICEARKTSCRDIGIATVYFTEVARNERLHMDPAPTQSMAPELGEHTHPAAKQHGAL